MFGSLELSAILGIRWTLRILIPGIMGPGGFAPRFHRSLRGPRSRRTFGTPTSPKKYKTSKHSGDSRNSKPSKDSGGPTNSSNVGSVCGGGL